jgi:O-acetylserine/cysteine efflux transporter
VSDVPFTTVGLALAVASALAWSGLDAARKSLVNKTGALALAGALAVGHAVCFSAWAALDGLALDEGYLVPGALSAVFGGGGLLLFILAVERAPLGASVPFLSLTPALSALGAWALVGERPSWVQLVGGGVIVLGAVALYFADEHDDATPSGLALMTLSALAWSVSAATDKWALSHASPPVHGAVQGVVVAALALLALAARRDLKQLGALRGVGLPVVGTALLSFVALGLQLGALTAAWVTVVEATKRVLGVFGALVLGRLLFDERAGLKRLSAALAMAGGGALVVLG